MPVDQALKTLRASVFVFALLLLGSSAAGTLQLAGGHCHAGPLDEQVVSAYVYDGDTLQLQDGRRVRLVGIDTPEIGHRGNPSQPLAEAARQAVQRLAGRGTRLGLQYDRQRHDHYGRLLAHVFLASGTNLQALLLVQGFGTALVMPPDLRYLECYKAAEAQARENRLGIWSLPRYQPLAAQQLPRSARGFHVVTGVVQRVGLSRSSVWLDLSPGFALRIPRQDLRYFTAYDPTRLRGRRVRAHGWISRRRGELRMTVRHPADLEVAR